MKKRMIPAIAALLTLALLSLSSCGVIAGLGAGGGADFSGEYKSISTSPLVAVRFIGASVTVSVGTRSISGSYTATEQGDGLYSVEFDFGDQTISRCPIRTGTYPVSFGSQNGVDYMLVFGSRYNKVG